MKTVRGYRITREIARTDRAIVYEGKKKRDTVAIKVVENDAYGEHEVEMLQLMNSVNGSGPAHVMRLLDSHTRGPDLYITLEHFHATLGDLHYQDMTPLALMRAARDSAKGLVEMESVGIVDDDVKPHNIAFKAASGRVAHVDLGCARRTGEKPRGYTPDYVAPEIEAGEPSDTSPCYGWARTMEFLTTGKIGLGPEYLVADFTPWIGRRFAEFVAMCCSPHPGERPSVPQLYQEVKGIVQERKRCDQCGATRFADAVCVSCGR